VADFQYIVAKFMSRIQNREYTGSVLYGLVLMTGLLAVIILGSVGIIFAPAQDGKSGLPKSVSSGDAMSIAGLPGNGFSYDESEPAGPEMIFFLTVPAVVGSYSLDDNCPAPKAVGGKAFEDIKFRRFDALTTTASISPEKACEFTLVGAKPSGTS